MSLTKFSLAGNSYSKLFPAKESLLFPARESLVCDISSGDGKTDKLFLQCIAFLFFAKLQLAKLQVLTLEYGEKGNFLHSPRRATRKIELSLAQKREKYVLPFCLMKKRSLGPFIPPSMRDRE
jgi:hypothetical protein